jgi:predicted alpha/beta superfamily hydrolase
MVKKWKVKIPMLSGQATRRVYLYLPESYEREPDRRYPVMYMFDGHNVFFDTDATYGKSWGMNKYMRRTRKQMIIVAVECNHAGNGRLQEYSPVDFENASLGKIQGKGKIYMQWLVSTLKPFIDSHYRTMSGREHTMIAGSSMGGLMSLYAVCTYNNVFQRAACLSPSIWVDYEKVMALLEKANVLPDTTVYMDYGSKEMANHAANMDALTATARMLLNKKVNLTLRIVPGGEHCEASWERQIPVFMECLGV